MSDDGPEPARRALACLNRWLVEDAYPVWAAQGWDTVRGGFHERLAADGRAPRESRRVRVQLRQIYCFARARQLGWGGDARWLVVAGLDHLLTRYRRDDGLFRTLVSFSGEVLDDRALLYDQAFALLAFAHAHRVLGPDSDLPDQAGALLQRIENHFRNAGRGFLSDTRGWGWLLSNPHMHLLEAALAWTGIGDDPRWRRLSDELVALALERMIDPSTGSIREQFAEDWSAFPGISGRVLEPGHQFEWGWLLLQDGIPGTRARPAASRLIEVGEKYGVRDGVAVNSLLDDMTVHDGGARLWPQSERLKAHARLARLTGEPGCWLPVGLAARTLLSYLGGARGLWRDNRTAGGLFNHEPAPASSFYHIVCAIGELQAALAVDAATAPSPEAPMSGHSS